jgi:integrase/recombinase XerD
VVQGQYLSVFSKEFRKEADMDLSREASQLCGFFHPDLFCEEPATYPSSTFPSLQFIEDTLSIDPEKWVKGLHVLDPLWLKLRKQDLPGRKHVEEYLRHQYRHHCRFNTIRNSYITLEFFLRFIKGLGRVRVEEMEKTDLEAFIEHEQDRGLKLSTVRTRVAVVKAFFHFLMERGVIGDDVYPWRLKMKLPETLPRAMDPDDVARLLSVQGSVRDRAMILLLLRTGMRIGELLNTKVLDVNMREQKILIYEAEKNQRGRVVFFCDDAKEALKAWLNEMDTDKEFVFYGYRGNPLTYPAARMVFVKYLEKAGISQKGYTLHCLRHTYATDLLNARMPLECLEKLLGHTSLEVTRRYARLTDKTREEEYFKAMAIIERSERDGYHQCDRELQEVLEKTQLLPSYSEELHEHP